ncbi:hypothetical protein AeRB84_020651 [Aphanomyces euteiches]|nr:hypothetical protein AeRB84_020651 [Aphanomyces euteiches]
MAVDANEPVARSRGQVNDDDDDEVDGFLNDSPEFEKLQLEAKLERYATQLKEVKSRMQKWSAKRTMYQERIKELENRLKEQEDEFAEQEGIWEKQVMSMAQRPNYQNVNLVNNIAGRDELERQKAKDALRQMIYGAADLDQDETIDDLGNVRKSGRQRIVLLMRRLVPFVHAIKHIEARFGRSVSAYFVFCRWILLNYLLLLVPTVYVLTIHCYELVANDYSSWGTFTGVVPSFLLYPSFSSKEALPYSIFLTEICMVFLFISSYKWIREDQVSKLVQASDQSHQYKFSKLILNAWDFEATSSQDASDWSKGIGEALGVALYDDIKQEKIRNRSKDERYKLYARRIFATFLYLVIQSTCWALILMLTIFSSKLQQIIKDNVPSLTAYAASIVPLGAAVINGALPAIISILTKFERWDDQGFEIKAMVTRLFLAKVLNILIQLWSYGMLLDPYLYTENTALLDWMPIPSFVRSNVMIKFKSDVYSCRAEQVASGLIILVLTDFVVSKVSAIVTALLAKVIELIKQWNAKRKKRVIVVNDTRTEFLIAPKMVALMYSCTLYQFSIPLAPVTAVTSLMMLIVNFKFDKFYLQKFQKKPITPWSAKDAGTFFIKLYWTTVLIFLCCMYWFMNDTTLPKLCEVQEASMTQPLCTAKSLLASSSVCTIDTTSHAMSPYFLDQMSSTSSDSECKIGYPACFEPLTKLLSTQDGIKILYSLSTEQLAFVWAVVGILLMQVMLKSNSIQAIGLVGSLKEQESKSQISSLLKKLKAQEKKLKLQKLQS